MAKDPSSKTRRSTTTRTVISGGGAVDPQGPFKAGGSVGGGGPFRSGGSVGGDGPFKPGGPVVDDGPFSLGRHVVSRFAAQPRLVAGRHGIGYLPDVPDHRDKTFRTILELKDDGKKLSGEALLRHAELVERVEAKLPSYVNLIDTGKLTPIEDQGQIGSCTAHAVIGLAEYLIKTGTGIVTDLSRMFLYKATRNLMGVQGDTGAYIRTTIKAMAAFGVPPEERWPYTADLLDYEPMAFQYAYAANFKAMKYARLDAYGLTTKDILDHVKRALAAGFPAAFGFPVHDSIRRVTWDTPWIPLPGGREDPQVGGHAVLAVGYDDSIEVPGQSEPGVLIMRNSWGKGWGREGYGYLPYYYVLKGLAVDFWTIYSSQWIAEDMFN